MINCPVTDCPYCKSQRNIPLGEIPSSSIFAGKILGSPMSGGCLYWCQDCFLKFRFPVLTPGEYKNLYDNEIESVWDTAVSSREDWKKIIAYLRLNMPEGGGVLDFGCYKGGLLSQLPVGYRKFGVEINKKAAVKAITNGVENVWERLEDIPNDIKFDAIVAADIIEHFPNPGILVQALMHRLSPDGVLILTTGDADSFLWKIMGSKWWYCSYLEHVAFISRRWLRKFCIDNGYQIKAVENFNYQLVVWWRVPFHWLLMLFYRMAPNLYRGVTRKYRQALGLSQETTPRGRGLSKDHIFVVLAN